MFSFQARRLILPPVAAAAALAFVALAPNSSVADRKGPVVIDVTQPKRSLYPIAVPVAVDSDAELAKEIAQVASFDLSIAGWFRVVDPKSYLANLAEEKLSIVPKKWADVGAFGVIKSKVVKSGNAVTLTFRLYEVEKGNRPVLSKDYKGDPSEVRQLTHRFCNEVVRYYTGEDGFFDSRIAFVVKDGKATKAIKTMDFDGNGVSPLTRNRSINILPAWSPDGQTIAFTSYMRANPDLYTVGPVGGRPKRLAHYPGMNTGASFSPDGRQIAITLSKDGDPELYVLDARTGETVRRLTRSRHIETSPAWSPNGREIAFVSNREGGPQIFVMNADGTNQRRVSRNGDYNTEPTWSPQKGKRVLAYTTRDSGRYDIVTLDLDSQVYTRITQGTGNNERPSFAPNGRAIAFASTRRGGSGVYIANADGTGSAVRVYSGPVTSVSWGPSR
jgi:TolB protein